MVTGSGGFVPAPHTLKPEPGHVVPRVVIAAPHSGAGKTTVTLGLLSALRSRGLEVSAHKVGPDYIDPGWHHSCTGRPPRNLDLILQGAGLTVPLLLHGFVTPTPADVAVIEGVMGLFDGAMGRQGQGSTAHVASLTQTPVILVVDAGRTARSVAATVEGFRNFDDDVNVAGVIVNHVASPRHEREIRAALAERGIPVVGMLPKDVSLQVGSRHLGLITSSEHTNAHDIVDRAGESALKGIDLDAVMEIARSAPPLPGNPWDPTGGAGPVTTRQPVIAVFGGPAFTFSYSEGVELLTAAGASVVVVDPLSDPGLPADVAGIVIGGGFPELHVGRLAANTSLLAQVSDAARDGVPVSAECAGLLYLGGELEGNGMCGVLDITARMTPTLTMGYRYARAAAPSSHYDVSDRVTGHEFHRTTVTPQSGAGLPSGSVGGSPAWIWADPALTEPGVDGWRQSMPAVVEGFADASIHASYLHTHPAAHPRVVRRFVENAVRVKS